jgi:hypothetical protein
MLKEDVEKKIEKADILMKPIEPEVLIKIAARKANESEII